MSAVSATISHSGIYAVGIVIRFMTSFVMLPIYTRYLTPADYGILELLTATLDLAAIIFGMRIGEAIFRNYSAGDTPRQKNAVITTSMALHVLTFGAGILALILLAGPISYLTFGTTDLKEFVQLFAIIIFLQALSEVPMVFVRARQKPWLFVGFNILRLLLQVGFNIYFVVVQDQGIEGVIYGSLLSSLCFSSIMLIYALRISGFERPDYSLGKRLIGFSLPLMLADIGAFYLTFGDRYFLRVYSSLSEIGIYALAYKFGFVLATMVWLPFSYIWDIQKYNIHKQPDAKYVFQRTFLMLSFILILFGLGISLFVEDVLKIMSAPAFWPASKIVPVVVVAYIVQAWTSYCSLGIYLRGNTMQVTYGSIVASVAITASYLVLIPILGGMGAAIATLLAFLVRLVWIDYAARQHYNMDLPWIKAISILAVSAAFFLLSLLWTPKDWLHSLLWKSLLCIGYVGIFLVLPIFTKHQKASLFAIVRNPRKIGQLIG